MSQGVDRLKELLFQPESEAIANLSARIDAVFDRAGTRERFQASVATVLDGALREAEIARHDEVATAIAPLIVRTVKTEITNSTDELVEALYPATGRMVKAYVASAISDLTNEINRRLDANPVMLRLNSILTGRSVSELALADTQKLKVEDVFLIRRTSGELVARWPKGAAGSNLDHAMGGVLTAINDFTSEAFKSDGSALRQIDLGAAKVYLRGSPAYLLAAKCSGTPSAGVEQAIDEEFLDLIERHHAALDAGEKGDGVRTGIASLLQQLSSRLEGRLADLQPDSGSIKRGMRPLTLLAFLIGIPLVALLLWNAYVDFRISRTDAAVRAAISATPQMNGYPYDIKVSDRGASVTLQGLAPTEGVKADLLGRIHSALPSVTVDDQLSTVPAGSADLRPVLSELKKDQRSFEDALKEASARQLRDRSARLIERASRLLKASMPEASAADKPKLDQLAKTADGIAGGLAAADTAKPLEGFAADIRQLTAAINALAVAELDQGTGAAILKSDPVSNAAATETIAELAERTAMAARSYVELTAVKRRFDDETARLRATLAVTPRAELKSFVRDNAIFFVTDANYRDEAEASRILDALARIMSRDNTLFLRVLGFTDEVGTPARNSAVAKQRADAVVAALAARGVAPARMIALPRTSPENNVSPVTGAASSNRRVEFEVGFIGEGAR